MDNRVIYLKNGKDVYGKKTELFIYGEKIYQIKEEIKSSDVDNLKKDVGIQTIRIIDLKENTVMPGVIDIHTHMREPGITYKEDFETGSRACAKGGITTFFDMPNTLPPTTSLNELILKKEAAKRKAIVNYGFHFGGSNKNNTNEIKQVLRNKEANTVKIFMNVTTGEMLIEDEKILKEIFKNSKLILVHAENEMIDQALFLNEKYGNGLYICHIPSKEELIKVIKGKKDKKINNNKHPVYVEVTPHHLFLNEKIRESSERNKLLLRMKPELRTSIDNEFLWEALNKGEIDTIGTDHAPHLINEKLEKVTFGMPGVETSLGLMLNAFNEGKIKLEKIQELMCENPAKIMKIKERGFLKEGYYADIIVVDLTKKWKVTNKELESKCRWSPYENWELQGKNILTIVNGKIVYENGKIQENIKNGKEIEFYE